MKVIYLFCSIISINSLYSQNFQIHYDFRHSIDPKQNSKNYPTLYFEYFKSQDPGTSFIKLGSFLLKMQSDLYGEYNNISKFYMQVSQSFRFWEPNINLSIQYSGGLGITEPKQYSYYISNAYSLGVSYPFQYKNAWFSNSLSYSYNSLIKPSNDLLYSFYWGKGFLNYKIEFVGDFEIWTLNKNQGDISTRNQSGKRLSFYGEPQLWYNIIKYISIGSKINLYYHVFTYQNTIQIYPTIAIKYKIF
jgi:hypothetical protein